MKILGRAISGLAVGLTALITLTGCINITYTGESPVSNSDVKFKIEETFSDFPLTKQTPAYDIFDGNVIVLYLGGSGSCPPVVDKIKVEDGAVMFYEKNYGDRACTMDYRLYSYMVTVLEPDFSFIGKTVLYCSYGGCNIIPLSTDLAGIDPYGDDPIVVEPMPETPTVEPYPLPSPEPLPAPTPSVKR